MSKKIIIIGQYYKNKLKGTKDNGKSVNNLMVGMVWGIFKNIGIKRTLTSTYRDQTSFYPYLYNSMLLPFNLLIWLKDAESINC